MTEVFRAIGVSRLRIVNDGEGVTTLVAGHGCPLRCKYCLNPQCFMKPEPLRVYTVQELLDEVRIDDLYFQATGGGIVFGGGEPLLQADFIHAFCDTCPKEWKLSLETSLAVETTELEKVLPDICFYLVDIKDMNPEIYHAYTGRENDLVYKNLQYLIAHTDPANVLVRIPLIKGYNTASDCEESIQKLRKMGYTRFDHFPYDTVRPLEKRK